MSEPQAIMPLLLRKENRELKEENEKLRTALADLLYSYESGGHITEESCAEAHALLEETK